MAKSAAGPAAGGSAKAPAGPAPSAADAAEAKRHFDIGFKLFKESVYDAALLEFQQSYKLGKRPSALRNIAQCHRELKQFVDAYEAFEKLLADHGPQLKEAERKDYQRAMNDLALVTALIEIKANEPGADILVDGKTVAQTPASKKLRVAVGTRKVRLQKETFEPQEKEISVVGQQEATLDFQLKVEVLQGHLVVRERTNQNVKVLVDEKEVGGAPWEGDLAPGVHSVEARGVNLAAPKQTIEITNKGKAELVLDAVSTAAKVRIVALPPVAAIAIDGQRLATGSYEGDLPEGDHKLEVTALGHQAYVRQIKAIAGQTLSQDVTLTPEPTAAAVKEDKPEYTGMYGSLFFAGQFELSGGSAAWGCAANQTCERLPHLGGGLGLRFGYNIEYIGIEAVGMFTGSYSQQSMTAFGAPPTGGQIVTPDSIAQRAEQLHVIGYSPFLGLGVRASNKGSVRFTAGFTPGISFRNMAVIRRFNSGITVADVPTSSVGQTGFGFMWDAGVMFGSSPGTKITLGIMGLVDFNDQISVTSTNTFTGLTPNGTVTVTDGPFRMTRSSNIFIGPSVGFQWGH